MVKHDITLAREYHIIDCNISYLVILIDKMVLIFIKRIKIENNLLIKELLGELQITLLIESLKLIKRMENGIQM